MNLKVISLSKSFKSISKVAEEEYIKRIPKEYNFLLQEVSLKNTSSKLTIEEIKKREFKQFQSKLPKNSSLVILDENGKQWSSNDFATFIKKEKNSPNNNKNIVFAIGGAYGWSEEVRKTTRNVISLSKCTLPGHLARLILIEQLYRATTIIDGKSYHK